VYGVNGGQVRSLQGEGEPCIEVDCREVMGKTDHEQVIEISN